MERESVLCRSTPSCGGLVYQPACGLVRCQLRAFPAAAFCVPPSKDRHSENPTSLPSNPVDLVAPPRGQPIPTASTIPLQWRLAGGPWPAASNCPAIKQNRWPACQNHFDECHRFQEAASVAGLFHSSSESLPGCGCLARGARDDRRFGRTPDLGSPQFLPFRPSDGDCDGAGGGGSLNLIPWVMSSFEYFPPK
jgi:hypothetical protein